VSDEYFCLARRLRSGRLRAELDSFRSVMRVLGIGVKPLTEMAISDVVQSLAVMTCAACSVLSGMTSRKAVVLASPGTATVRVSGAGMYSTLPCRSVRFCALRSSC